MMRRRGYQRSGAQGGDWGSASSRELGLIAGDHIIGVHLNMLFPWVPEEATDLTDAERSHVETMRRFRATGSGYGAIQSTRPQTLAYGLTDSPAGPVAWIAAKLCLWSHDRPPCAPASPR